MNNVEGFRSQLLACGTTADDATEGARLYDLALRTCEDADWRAFYRTVHASLQRIRETGRTIDVFSQIEIAGVLLLLQDDLGAQLFSEAEIRTLARGLLHRGKAMAN